MEFLFQHIHIFLMRFVIEVILSLQVFDEPSHSVQHIFFGNFVVVLFNQDSDLLQCVVLVHVRKRYKAVSMGRCFSF